MELLRCLCTKIDLSTDFCFQHRRQGMFVRLCNMNITDVLPLVLTMVMSVCVASVPHNGSDDTGVWQPSTLGKLVTLLRVRK